MASPAEQVKARLGIADVVGSYIKLERAGANFRARCPFHNEKTPSFHISPSRESFHCFGCDKGGDIFTFVEEIEGVDFREALKILADKAGIQIVDEDPRVRGERERLIEILELATKFYEAQLEKHSEAKEYLASRGITRESVMRFRIGFAPAEWRGVYSFLRAKKYSDVEIEKAGLTIQATRPGPNGERYFDRFRSRVMFPLSDGSGRVVGFSGRIFGEAKPDTAKYVNSPQTALYDKSRVLYGYDKAKAAIRSNDVCVCVEGQMDLVLSHQAGLTNTVAVSGTALTDHHLGAIIRLTKNIVFAFDGDAAGVSASGRGIERAIALGFEVKIATLPPGQDPADLVRNDPEQWLAVASKAEHVISFYLAHVAGKGYDPLTLRREVGKLVLPYIAQIGSAIEQAHFITEVAHVLGTDEGPIRDDVKRIVLEAKSPTRPEVVLQKPVPVPTAQSLKEKIERRVYAFLAWQEQAKPPLVPVEWLGAELQRITGDMHERILARMSRDNAGLVFEAENLYGNLDSAHLKRVAEELVTGLETELLKEQLQKAKKELREAEAQGDEARIEEKLRLCQDIGSLLTKLARNGQKTS